MSCSISFWRDVGSVVGSLIRVRRCAWIGVGRTWRVVRSLLRSLFNFLDRKLFASMSQRISVLRYGVNHFRLRQNAIGQLIQLSPPRQQPASILIRPRQTPLKNPSHTTQKRSQTPSRDSSKPSAMSFPSPATRPATKCRQNPNNSNHNQQINHRKRLGLSPQPRQKQIVHSLPKNRSSIRCRIVPRTSSLSTRLIKILCAYS